MNKIIFILVFSITCRNLDNVVITTKYTFNHITIMPLGRRSRVKQLVFVCDENR